MDLIIVGSVLGSCAFSGILECIFASKDTSCNPMFYWIPGCKSCCKPGNGNGPCNYDDTFCGCTGHACYYLEECPNFILVGVCNTIIRVFLCPCICETTANCISHDNDIDINWKEHFFCCCMVCCSNKHTSVEEQNLGSISQSALEPQVPTITQTGFGNISSESVIMTQPCIVYGQSVPEYDVVCNDVCNINIPCENVKDVERPPPPHYTPEDKNGELD